MIISIIILVSSAISHAEEYVLQAGDVISINVVEHPEFSGRHKIRPDGRINYPVIGEVDVATLTPAQLVKIMQGKLSSYVNNPVVSVSIEAYYANKIFIIGKWIVGIKVQSIPETQYDHQEGYNDEKLNQRDSFFVHKFHIHNLTK